MDDKGVPRSVRVAAVLTATMGVAGLLLIVAGALDLHWWSTPTAAKLSTLLDQIRVEQGAQPPALLRSGGRAVELLILGAVGLAYAALALLIGRGRRWARTWGLALGIATFLIGLVEIGADASQPTYLQGYLDALANAGAAELVPRVEALATPAWYGWVEDIAQGLQVVTSLAATIALAAAGILHPYHFAAKETAEAPPDEWSAAITRFHEQTVRARDRPDDTP